MKEKMLFKMIFSSDSGVDLNDILLNLKKDEKKLNFISDFGIISLLADAKEHNEKIFLVEKEMQKKPIVAEFEFLEE